MAIKNIVYDNGQSFPSSAFKEYLQKKGIKHR